MNITKTLLNVICGFAELYNVNILSGDRISNTRYVVRILHNNPKNTCIQTDFKLKLNDMPPCK